MITNLQNSGINSVAGGRFLPGLTRRLNNLVKPVVENGVARDIAKVAEQAGKVVVEIFDIKANAGFKGDDYHGDFEVKPRVPKKGVRLGAAGEVD